MKFLTYTTIPIQTDFQIQVLAGRGDQDLSQEMLEMIDRLWIEEKRKREQMLFNGLILSATAYDQNVMRGHFISYKEFVAWNRLTQLHQTLELCPVGLNGLTLSGNRLLVGKRSMHMAHSPGKYECAPAGAVDAHYVQGNQIDYRKLLMTELEEETGLLSEQVEKIKPIALIERANATCKAVELFVAIRMQENLGLLPMSETKEYGELFWLGPKELADFLALRQDEILTSSRRVIEQWFRDHEDLLKEF